MPPTAQQGGPHVLDLPDHLLAQAFAAAYAADLPSLRWGRARQPSAEHLLVGPQPAADCATTPKLFRRLTCKGFKRPATEAARALRLRRLGGAQRQLSLSDMPRLREVDVAEVPGADWSEGFLLQLAEQVRRGGRVGSNHVRQRMGS